MSQDVSQADAADTADAADAGTASDGDDPSRKLSWEEAAAGFEKQRQQRKSADVEIPGMGIATFVLRALTQEERDQVERKATSVRQNGRRDADVEVNAKAIRHEMLKHGVVEGPEGFKPHREDHLGLIPPGVQDELVEIIDDMSSLAVEEYDSFQEMG